MGLSSNDGFATAMHVAADRHDVTGVRPHDFPSHALRRLVSREARPRPSGRGLPALNDGCATIAVSAPSDAAALKATIDERVQSTNLIVALRITGEFRDVHTRTVVAQHKPH
jgi:hypothetical protein